MEGTQSKLGTGLSDGLGCNHSDNLALLDHTAGGQVAAVALGADTLAALAGEYRTDFNLLDGQRVDKIGFLLPDFLAGLDNQLSGQRVEDIVHGSTSENSLAQRLNHFVLVLDGGCDESSQSAAVLVGDDHVVGYIHKTSGQVTCIRSLEGGIGKTLSGTVGGDEVLEH